MTFLSATPPPYVPTPAPANFTPAPAFVAHAASAASGLATTGTYVDLAVVWGAVGLVALGTGLVVVRRVTRRRSA